MHSRKSRLRRPLKTVVLRELTRTHVKCGESFGGNDEAKVNDCLMREDEEICRKCFDRYLRTRLGSRILAWEEGGEPPDYYLRVDNRRFADSVR